MTCRVRRLTSFDDTGEAAALLARFFAEEGFDTAAKLIRRRIAEMTALDTCGLFVAEAESSAVGVATISLEFGIEFGWSGEMGDLYVVPEWRGRGVSRSLVAAIETFLAERGASGYQVTVTPVGQANHDLRSFYAKLGFT
ncbi:MAG: GNAT family N-acetyltransferase, partial [Hyphomicrobiales bacterium]